MYGELCELREQLFSHLRGYVYYYHNYRRKIKRRKLKQETIKNIIRSERISLQHAIFIFITLVLLFFAVFFFSVAERGKKEELRIFFFMIVRIS